MFSLPDLNALVTVADIGSVRGAASVLHRTQPAVTQAIRRLEDAAGFPLLDRSSYRARLTERGESFVAQARNALWHARKLKTFASLLATGVEPRLRIEVDSAIPADHWTCLVEGMPEKFPETTVEVECGEGNATLRRLLQGDANLALLFDVTVSSHSLALERVPVGEIEFRNVVRSDKAHLLDESRVMLPLILVADFEDSGAEYGAIEGQHFWRVSNHRMQAEAILAGLGWGMASKFMVQDKIADGTLVPRAQSGLMESSFNAISLYRSRDVPIGKAAEFLWEQCKSRQNNNI